MNNEPNKPEKTSHPGEANRPNSQGEKTPFQGDKPPFKGGKPGKPPFRGGKPPFKGGKFKKGKPGGNKKRPGPNQRKKIQITPEVAELAKKHNISPQMAYKVFTKEWTIEKAIQEDIIREERREAAQELCKKYPQLTLPLACLLVKEKKTPEEFFAHREERARLKGELQAQKKQKMHDDPAQLVAYNALVEFCEKGTLVELSKYGPKLQQGVIKNFTPYEFAFWSTGNIPEEKPAKPAPVQQPPSAQPSIPPVSGEQKKNVPQAALPEGKEKTDSQVKPGLPASEQTPSTVNVPSQEQAKMAEPVEPPKPVERMFEIHRLELKYFYNAQDASAVKKWIMVDKTIQKKHLRPAYKPTNRYKFAESTLQIGAEIMLALHEGEMIRGKIVWFTPYDILLEANKVRIWVFRHAVVECALVRRPS